MMADSFSDSEEDAQGELSRALGELYEWSGYRTIVPDAVTGHYERTKAHLAAVRDNVAFDRWPEQRRHVVTLAHDVLRWTPLQQISLPMIAVFTHAFGAALTFDPPMDPDPRRGVDAHPLDYQRFDRAVRDAGFHVVPPTG